MGQKFRRRLVAPMFSSKRPPEYAARGVGIGLLFAFTPLVGAQILIVLAFWSFVRSFAPKYDFNVIVAMAGSGSPMCSRSGRLLRLCEDRQFMLGRWMSRWATMPSQVASTP